ncbi:hybrid sensor histidine kinase/response regulator [Halopseudomonas salegens]|uniref:histidine kinase n=1 Tax=Halopseudomonas salegens TaxID=1434072 RepID=A0A1H2FDX3_9GAMM|nr:ATP-binding protein [Halopseudomonas salegens]SDU05596.1 Signal transduction histidine kinase [Halopseudomonas salegens]
MSARQHIFRVRRNYNQWVANETLEDYALRFTAKKARRWSPVRVASTALGAISFLALEAIGGAITLHYGFTNALYAILVVSLVILLTAIPISYYAAKYGVDSDLLTRGAGFGYIGSTITSLIYATFTFIFFALEAVIMAMALELLFGIPLAWGYVICAIVIIPLVTHGITLISRFQLWTQPFWIVLQLVPFVFIIWMDVQSVDNWTSFAGVEPGASGDFNLLMFGAAAAVMFALIAQIGEQVDFLRFVPEQKRSGKRAWWTAIMAGGPGWIIIGAIKLLAGSFLAVLALSHGVPEDEAADPTRMYMIAFGYLTSSPQVALAAAGIFVILCQVKINVTNAYAGSIAWSNFFSRLTHSHPGRVVWLVFNVSIALLVMELGVYRALEETLGYYGVIAIAWAGALVADLVINKPLGFSPPHIEFKRAHLYDINPVGVGAMLTATLVGMLCFTGLFGPVPQALAHFITLATALVIAPLIAWLTQGRYYLARPVAIIAADSDQDVECCICENHFEPEDMTSCPAYGGTICSLCCSLDARCDDFCKPGGGYAEQIRNTLSAVIPARWMPPSGSRVGHFFALLLLINGITALMLSLIYQQTAAPDAATQQLLAATLLKVFFILLIITGVISWLFVLAHESRRVAQEESNRQNRLLMEEIEAHEQTDQALQQAKEQAEAANLAKSRYLTGISHELRSPLNAVMGYAQLLQQDPNMPAERQSALTVIRRSSEYLADLIEGLLDISKIEAGRLDLQQDSVRLDLLLDQLVNMFRLQAEEKGLRFRFNCPTPLPQQVKADEKRLRQILINLLSNAIKYTEQGDVSLTVRYRSGVAEFKVQDSGEGISTDNLERIFMPFERVRLPGSTATGTGLGLTISKLLCEIMGGDISVTSVPGEGSTFRVSLLLSSIQQVVAPSGTVTDTRIAGFSGKTRHILIIDDDVVHRQLMRSLLQPLGFTISELGNPLLAIDKLNETPIDLILLDLSMPGLSGWTLLQQIRAHGHQTPVVIVSANAGDGKDPHLADQPAQHNAYITKPVQLAQLLDRIGSLLALDWQQQSLFPAQVTEPAAASSSGPLATSIHAQLMQLATIGHRKGLLEALYNLKQSDSDNSTLYQQLILLSENFQFDAIKQTLQEATDECP